MYPQKHKSSDDRPLTGNSTGKYNLNFIDQTNDLSSYCNGDLSPQLQELIKNYFETITWSERSNQKNHFQPVINMCESQLFHKSEKKNKTYKEHQKQIESVFYHCSVCTQSFKENEQVKVLPCTHLFHKQCIKPWFELNSNCPNCRFDIYEGKIVEK